MYGGSVLKLTNQSTMTAKRMSTDSGNINAFYSGDTERVMMRSLWKIPRLILVITRPVDLPLIM